MSRTKINDNHKEFYLGRFYPPRQGLSLNKELNYLDTNFFEGSFCDLNSSPRISHIRFICADDKQSMYITNVMETSACSYDFMIHVPELCNYLPKHGKDIKKEPKIKCFGYRSSIQGKAVDGKPPKKVNKKMDDLDKILSLIETSYKDSSLLLQYKNLLSKATENLKSQQLSNDLSLEDSHVSLTDLLAKISHKDDDNNLNHEDDEAYQH